VSELLKPILNAQEAADLLQCSVRSVQDYARSGRLPGVKFGDGWVFSSDLLVETVKKLSIEEAEKRSRPVRPIGVQVRTPKRKPPGMGHLSHEEIDHILSGKAQPPNR
jgi:excisionase family DNA binding protein